MGRKRVIITAPEPVSSAGLRLLGDAVLGCFADQGSVSDGEVADLAMALKKSAAFKQAAVCALRDAESYRRWPLKPVQSPKP